MSSAGNSYKIRALVLRKTKLAERDLVVTLLSETGEIVRAVAKGARKPGGSFAAKLELFSEIDALVARGRSLDVIADARFAAGRTPTSYGLEQAACASVVAELLSNVCQEGLEHPRLFEMAKAGFALMAECDADDALAVAAGALVKVISSAGFRPSLGHCQACGGEIDLESTRERVLFSIEEGGATCAGCARETEGAYVEAQAISWTRALLFSRFDEICSLKVDPSASFGVLQLMKPWLEHYGGRRLKSLDYLFTSGLY